MSSYTRLSIGLVMCSISAPAFAEAPAAAAPAASAAPSPASGVSPTPAPAGPAADTAGASPVAPGAVPAEENTLPAPTPVEEAQPEPQMFVAQPPLPPLQPRSRHYHDGFYLRVGGGFGFLDTSSDVDNDGGSASANGVGVAFHALIGGTPTPGLVIGGGAVYQEVYSPSLSSNGAYARELNTGARSRLWMTMIGPMIDAFPNPASGFHVGGLVGPAWLGLEDKSGDAAAGVGLSVWTGYMWWVSSEASLGALLRLSGARTARTLQVGDVNSDVIDNARAVSLEFSAAFH